MDFDVCLTVRQCTVISHRYLRWLTGGGRQFLSQEYVETVNIVPEFIFIVCYFI
jgi:hypothetical protein